MTHALDLSAGIAALLALGACVEDTGTAMAPATGVPFIRTYGASVSNAAVNACRNTLDAETDGAVQVVGTEFAQANSAVYMEVGSSRAPWRCLVVNDGQGATGEFMGSEGAL